MGLSVLQVAEPLFSVITPEIEIEWLKPIGENMMTLPLGFPDGYRLGWVYP